MSKEQEKYLYIVCCFSLRPQCPWRLSGFLQDGQCEDTQKDKHSWQEKREETNIIFNKSTTE